MKKLQLYIICMGLVLAQLGGIGLAQAELVTIGTATYDDGSGADDYNLIWDDDNNGNSVVWLDYTNAPAFWADQNAWADGLDGQLTYNIDAMYNVTWDDPAWRLPSTVDGPNVFGYDGTTTAGYNITTSEMGHLFFTELGNHSNYDTSGNSPQPGYGLVNTGDFEHLVAAPYWTSTEYELGLNQAWHMSMHIGGQGVKYTAGRRAGRFSALAIRSGQVSAATLPIGIDIKAGSCPNPINTRSKGVLPVAILGTDEFDVTQVDPETVKLEGVAPLRWSIEDVASQYAGDMDDCDIHSCTAVTYDGLEDLTLKFKNQEVVAALGTVGDGDCLLLELTGNLKEEFGGTPIAGKDVVLILKKK